MGRMTGKTCRALETPLKKNLQLQKDNVIMI